MAAPKDLITPGIGFAPGKAQFMVTRGLSVGGVAVVVPRHHGIGAIARARRLRGKCAWLLPLLGPWLERMG